MKLEQPFSSTEDDPQNEPGIKKTPEQLQTDFKRKMHLQMELVERHYGFSPTDATMTDWVDSGYAKEFGDFLIQHERDGHNLLDDYENSPEKTLEYIESKLYQGHHKQD